MHGYSALLSEHVPLAKGGEPLAGAGHEAIGHEALGVYLGRDARSSALVGMALLGPDPTLARTLTLPITKGSPNSNPAQP